MTDVDRFVCSELCKAVGRPGQDIPASYLFTACVRCPLPEERLVGGIARKPKPPSIRVEPRPEAWRTARR